MPKYNLYSKRNGFISESVGTALGWGLELTIENDKFPTREDIPPQVFETVPKAIEYIWFRSGSWDEAEFLDSHIIVDDTIYDINRKGLTVKCLESPDKIGWCIISNNQNPEYKDLAPNIIKRWNQLGIKVLYLDCYERASTDELSWDTSQGSVNPCYFDKDDFGNVTLRLKTVLHYPYDLDRYFAFMVARFWIAGHVPFINKKDIVVISDGDLVPINKRSIFSPSFGVNIINDLKHNPDTVICTNSYQNGCPMATYTYALSETFEKVLPFNNLSELQLDAVWWSYRIGARYHNDEKYMYYRYKTASINLQVLKNRLQGRDADLTTLRAHMIDLIYDPSDLNFIELHNIRSYDHIMNRSELNTEQYRQYMTRERWDKLFTLLEDFDKMNIAPSNYFWGTIENPWRDTLITKSGELILGDEYD